MNQDKRFKYEMVVRMLADALLLNFAALAATIIRFLYRILVENPSDISTTLRLFSAFLSSYERSAIPFTIICLVIFYYFGFYTYGRTYRGRYKVLIVIQAVSVSYLVFGFISYFIRGTLEIPRGILVLAWLFSAVLLAVARVWALLWSNVVRTERRSAYIVEERGVKRILVIGGAGYIGSALIPRLLDKGYRVRILDLLMYGDNAIRDFLSHPHLGLVKGDFRQVDKVVDVMLDIDAVIHLGAIVGDPACSLNEEVTIEVNLMATRMLAEVAKGSGVSRFIFASSCSVYGANDEVLDERSGLNPVSLYARSKIASERVLLEMANERFSPVILRFGTIYGLSGRTRFDLVVNLLTAKAVTEGKITVYGGDQWRPFIHVDDAALAILKCVEARLDAVKGEVFNVGSNDQNLTLLQAAEAIKALVPDAELLELGYDGDKRNYRVDFSKIQRRIGFIPKWKLRDGIIQVKDAIESGRVKDYRSARYSNVKFLNEEGLLKFVQPQNGWAQKMIKDAGVGSTLRAAK